MALRFILLASALVASALGQFTNRATLYDQLGGVGNSVTTSEQYVQDLTSLSFNDRARSANVTGIWIFYEDPNYNKARDAGVEYAFGVAPSFRFNFDYLVGRVSSARFGGLAFDYTYSTFTIYEFDFFQGDEEYLNFDASVLNLEGRTASIIITGTSAWTVYDQRNFGGNAICVYPPTSSNFTPGFLTDTTTAGIPHNTVRSVRKGCIGRNMIRIEASTHGAKSTGTPSLRS